MFVYLKNGLLPHIKYDDMKTTLEIFRTYLKEKQLAAYIVPATDPFFGEYIAERHACRAHLSGFGGSAGCLVLTATEAALWTDSRYFVRAEQEMAGRDIVLKKLKIPGTESIETWLLARCKTGDRVGIDGALFSLPEFEHLQKALHPLSLYVDEDPFDALWEGRPALRQAPAFLLPLEQAGQSVAEKHRAVVAAFSEYEDFVFPVIALDEIAWLLNMRGGDVDFNPVCVAVAAVTPHHIHVFMPCKAEGKGFRPTQLSLADAQSLEAQGVVFAPFADFEKFIAAQAGMRPCIITKERWSIARQLRCIVETGGEIITDPCRGGCITVLKARKNPVEQQGFRSALITEGLAWVRIARFIEQELASGGLTEQLLAQKIVEYRSLGPSYRGESFAAIVGYGPHGALPHYALNPEGADFVKPRGFLLIDSGGHYSSGTTDTTRTYCLSRPTPREKRDYTAVLKGMIQLSMAHFPKGTRGAQLDVLARGPVWAASRSYLHGTGHGIGHYLNVHEGPQSIRMEDNPVALEPGMVLSNEPGIYVEGQYGIRTENMLLCVPYEMAEQGEFYAFETLTRAPIDTRAIDYRLLGKDAVKWLNTYHAQVYADLAPLLNHAEAAWLRDKTLPI